MRKRLLYILLLLFGCALGVYYVFKPGALAPETPHPGAKATAQDKSGSEAAEAGISPEIFSAEDGPSSIEQVWSLPADLQRPGRESLYNVLRNAENNPRMHWVKNDIMNKLRNQEVPPEELTDVLIEMFLDKDEDAVMRAYALQHLRPWYRLQGVKDSRIPEVFFAALEERGHEVAGVALLSINYMVRDQEEFTADRVLKEAEDMLNDPATSSLNRVSALQVVAMRRGKTGDSAPYRMYAVPGNPLTLRLAAIAAIGQCGDQAAREDLNEYLSEDGPVAVAAITALTELDK